MIINIKDDRMGSAFHILISATEFNRFLMIPSYYSIDID